MKTIKYFNALAVLTSIFFLVYSCAIPEIETLEAEQENAEADDEDNFSINIPAGFDFSTYRQVELSINDNASYVRYDVYAYTDQPILIGVDTYEDQAGQIISESVYRNDVMNRLIFSGVVKNGRLDQTINVPKFCNKLYLRRNDNLNFSSSIEDITNNQANYYHSPAGITKNGESTTVVNDYLYCVNGSGELFQVDPLDGQLTYLSDMPMGSWTCAIDQQTKTLYSIGRSSPHPLMKYYIETGEWEIIANLGIGGPRLDFNINDRLLYFSKNDKLYTFDPVTGANLNTWNIYGLHDLRGGDLAFAEDGTLFLCTFAGLYRLDLDANNDYQSTRISADNLPFQPTSMTFDSNQELWLANNASSSDLIIMDTQTGGWQYRYGTTSANGVDFGRTINDLTTFRVYSDTVDDTDTDGDGILDRDDSYPEDAEKAFEMFTPSKYGKGTIAFEDLWPSRGDYDFNDMAYTYQAVAILNSDNLVVQLDLTGYVKANGAGFNNGVGIVIEGISPAMVERVSGAILTKDYISLNANGTEASQSNAVIILCDNADAMTSETTVSIRFTDPIATQVLGVAPFNPFIIVNGQREKEVHLPYADKTDLALASFQVSGVNSDPDGNYISESGLPWAISIIHDFKVPKEAISIDQAYNHFVNWAGSGGIDYVDWYKDNPGYRNEGMLDN